MKIPSLASLVGKRSSFILPGTFSVHAQRMLCSSAWCEKVPEYRRAQPGSSCISEAGREPTNTLEFLQVPLLCLSISVDLHFTPQALSDIQTVRAYFGERNFEESEMHSFATVAPVN